MRADCSRQKHGGDWREVVLEKDKGFYIMDKYYKSISQEIESKFARVKDLVSNARLASGLWKESIFRDAFKNLLPSRYSVSTGYIKNNNSQKSSKQIDILIHDNVNFRPYFSADNFVVASSESVKAIIEIKSGAFPDDLEKAIENIKSAKDVTDRRITSKSNKRFFPLSCLIFTDSKNWKDLNAFGKALANYKEKIGEKYYPECIIVWNKFVAWTFWGKDNQKAYMQIASIEERQDISIALLLACVEVTLRANSGQKPIGLDWVDYISQEYFDIKNLKIWSKEGIRIGDGVMNISELR
jgi:hypothetical protein